MKAAWITGQKHGSGFRSFGYEPKNKSPVSFYFDFLKVAIDTATIGIFEPEPPLSFHRNVRSMMYTI